MFNTSIASIEIAAVLFKPHGRFFYSSTDGKQFVVSGVQRYPPDVGSLYRHIPCRAYGRRGGCVQYEYFPARRCSRCLYKQRKAQKVDRMRKHHFDFYADTLWGEPESYDLMLSSSEYGIGGAANVIAAAAAARK